MLVLFKIIIYLTFLSFNIIINLLLKKKNLKKKKKKNKKKKFKL